MYLSFRMFVLLYFLLMGTVLSIVIIPFDFGRGGVLISFIVAFVMLITHGIFGGFTYKENIQKMPKDTAIIVLLAIVLLTLVLIWLSFIQYGALHEN